MGLKKGNGYFTSMCFGAKLNPAVYCVNHKVKVIKNRQYISMNINVNYLVITTQVFGNGQVNPTQEN